MKNRKLLMLLALLVFLVLLVLLSLFLLGKSRFETAYPESNFIENINKQGLTDTLKVAFAEAPLPTATPIPLDSAGVYRHEYVNTNASY